MDKLRYLLIGDGSSPHLLKWVRELVKYYDVFLVSSHGIHPEINQLLPPRHLFPFELPVKRQGGYLAWLLKVPKLFSIIKKVSPAIVNAHYITSHGLLAAIVRQLYGKKFVLVQSAWGTDMLVTPFANRLYNSAARYCLNKAQLVTSDSEFMTCVVGRLTHTPVLTFTFGLDKLPDFDPQLKQPGLFFSNRILSENYNIEEVLRFFSRIVKDDDHSRLIIANDGNLKNVLEDSVRKMHLDRYVEFCGFIPQDRQTELYKRAEFFISIPDSDSTSVSLLEAMAYGCIPIVSGIPANLEWIRNGEGGILYSHDLDFRVLKNFRSNEATAIGLNRQLISEKAIFPDSMLHYSQYLTKYLER